MKKSDVVAYGIAAVIVIAIVGPLWLGVTWLLWKVYGSVGHALDWRQVSYWPFCGIAVLIQAIGGAFRSRPK